MSRRVRYRRRFCVWRCTRRATSRRRTSTWRIRSHMPWCSTPIRRTTMRCLAAARDVCDEIRELVAAVPGEAMSVQQSPMRKEKHYRKFKGDGPARMMAKFRTFEKSQLLITEDSAENFDTVVERVDAACRPATFPDRRIDGVGTGCRIGLRDDAVYIGVTNPVHRRQHGAHQLALPERRQERSVAVSRRGPCCGSADRSI